MLNVHLYSLPLFFLFWRSIVDDALLYSKSPLIRLPAAESNAFGLSISRQWLSLISTCSLQLLCIRSVYELTSHLNSLQLTMVLTLRKCINLALSIWLFDNEFNRLHFTAILLIFFGTFEFYGLSTKIRKIGLPWKAWIRRKTVKEE